MKIHSLQTQRSNVLPFKTAVRNPEEEPQFKVRPRPIEPRPEDRPLKKARPKKYLETYADIAKKKRPKLSSTIQPAEIDPGSKIRPAKEPAPTISGAVLFRHMHREPERLKLFKGFDHWVERQHEQGNGDGLLTRENFKKFIDSNERAMKYASQHEKFFDYLFDHAEAVGQKVFQLEVDHYL